jgi:hypothetical protein
MIASTNKAAATIKAGCSDPQDKSSPMRFIFEGEFDFRAIAIDFAVADNHVLFHDLGYA